MEVRVQLIFETELMGILYGKQDQHPKFKWMFGIWEITSAFRFDFMAFPRSGCSHLLFVLCRGIPLIENEK